MEHISYISLTIYHIIKNIDVASYLIYMKHLGNLILFGSMDGPKFSPLGDSNRWNKMSVKFSPSVLKTHLIWTKPTYELQKDQTTPHYAHVGTARV